MKLPRKYHNHEAQPFRGTKASEEGEFSTGVVYGCSVYDNKDHGGSWGFVKGLYDY